jgi:hypothetical protein
MVKRLDASNAAIASYAGHAFGTQVTVYVDDGVRLYDELGLPINREMERKVEQCPDCGAKEGGRVESITGCDALYRASTGELPAGFEVRSDGCTATLVDEDGVEWSHAQLLAALTLAESRRGTKLIALPYHSPVVCDKLAAQNGSRVLRLWRDVEAGELMARQKYALDGAHLASRIGWLARTIYGGNERPLASLMSCIPPICREIATFAVEDGACAKRMRSLASTIECVRSEFVSGARFELEDSYVGVIPGLRELKIVAEASSTEAAHAACEALLDKLRHGNSH